MIAGTPVRSRLAAELLREGRAVELPALGTSMRPLFAPGDALVVRPATVADVRPGDVVLVERHGRLCAHRLMRITPATLELRGDDLPAPDPPLPHAALLGRVEVPPSPRALYAALRALARSCLSPA
jgi:phage repressor protein C with HTH and peptisase S24 domain